MYDAHSAISKLNVRGSGSTVLLHDDTRNGVSPKYLIKRMYYELKSMSEFQVITLPTYYSYPKFLETIETDTRIERTYAQTQRAINSTSKWRSLCGVACNKPTT